MHGADDRKHAAPPAGPGRRQADRSHLYRRPGERHHLRAEIHHSTARTLHHGGAELSACHLLKVSLTRETAMHHEKPEYHWLWAVVRKYSIGVGVSSVTFSSGGCGMGPRVRTGPSRGGERKGGMPHRP